MPEEEFREQRAAVIVALILSLAIIALYISAEAAAHPVKLRGSTVVGRVDNRNVEIELSNNNRPVALITAALAKNDFMGARGLKDRLTGRRLQDQMSAVINSAEARSIIRQIACRIRSAQYGEARGLAKTLRDDAARNDLLDVVSFAEARGALLRSDVTRAVDLASALRPGLKRALLHTALAARYSDNRSIASQFASLAIEDLPWIGRPYGAKVLAMVARVMLKVDRDYGLAVLDRAVHETELEAASSTPQGGQEEGGRTSVRVTGGGFVEVISARGATQAFSLVIPGIAADLSQLLVQEHGRIPCLYPKAKVASANRTIRTASERVSKAECARFLFPAI